MTQSEHKARRHYIRRFWRVVDGVRTSAGEEDATELEIELRSPTGCTSLTFEWPGRRLDSERLERMLHRMHDIGVANAKGELRKWLGQ